MLKKELLNKQENNRLKPGQEEAIKNFLSKILHKGGEKPQKKYAPSLVDISRPMPDDLNKIAGGNYQISNFRATLRPDGKAEYHFYVGQTEFHIKGQAADDLTELIRTEI